MTGVDKKAAGERPGLLWVNSKLKQPDKVSPEDFHKWYEEVHIPDIFKSGGFKEAWRWESLNPADERPYLALYPLEDLDFLQSAAFKGEVIVDQGED
jgi:hypothetical protein